MSNLPDIETEIPADPPPVKCGVFYNYGPGRSGICDLYECHEGEHQQAAETIEPAMAKVIPPKVQLGPPVIGAAPDDNRDHPITLPCKSLPISNQSEIVSILKESRNMHMAVMECIHYQVREGTPEALDKATKLIEYLKKICAESAGRAT